MRAEIRPLISELRIFADDKHHGEPFEIGCAILHLNQEEIEIKLLDKKMGKAECLAVVEECRRLGIKRIKAVRYRDGQPYDKWINISRQ
jgi:hypothetical protein